MVLEAFDAAGGALRLQPALDHEERRPDDGPHAAGGGPSAHPACDVGEALAAVVLQQALGGRIAAQTGAVHKDLVDHPRHKALLQRSHALLPCDLDHGVGDARVPGRTRSGSLHHRTCVRVCACVRACRACVRACATACVRVHAGARSLIRGTTTCISPCSCRRVLMTSSGFVNMHAVAVALPPVAMSVRSFRFPAEAPCGMGAFDWTVTSKVGSTRPKFYLWKLAHTRTMALGHVPPFVAVSTPAAGGQRGLRVVAAAAVALALLAAVVAVQHGSVGRAALMEGSDESLKGWEDGMFPPHATFPAGYHFGDDNGNDLCPAEPLHSRASLTRPRLPFFPRAH